MNKYTLYIGANNETGERDVDVCTAELSKKFTDSKVDLLEMTLIVKDLCKELGQRCIIVQYAYDVNVDFVTL
jgi:hypothetical protein